MGNCRRASNRSRSPRFPGWLSTHWRVSAAAFCCSRI